MSKPVNKTLIGIFVISAIFLVIVALLIFGSGKYFTQKNKYVMYFDGSVKGLNVGAPVMLRGVRIGQVSNVLLLFNPKDLTTTIPVYIEIDTGQIGVAEEQMPIMKKSKQYQYIKPLIDKGLKGQLQMQSFVTGQLAINLDFRPDEPVRLVGLETKYPEIPTIPTGVEEMTKTFQSFDIKGLYNKLTSAIDGLNKLINAPGASETLTVASDTLKQTEKTLVAVENMTGDYTNLRYEINSLFREFSASSRSLRDLFDYLERHPESILVGKKNAKGD